MTATGKYYLRLGSVLCALAIFWACVIVLWIRGVLEQADALVWIVFLAIGTLAALVGILRMKSPRDAQAWDTFLHDYLVTDVPDLPEDLRASSIISKCGKYSKAYRNRRPSALPVYVGEVTLDPQYFDERAVRSLHTAFAFFAAPRNQANADHVLGVDARNRVHHLFTLSENGNLPTRERDGMHIIVFSESMHDDTEPALLADLRQLNPKSCLMECVGPWFIVYSLGLPSVADAERMVALVERHAS